MERREKFINDTINKQSKLEESSKKAYIARLTKLINIIPNEYLIDNAYDKSVFRLRQLDNIVKIIDNTFEKYTTRNAYITALYNFLVSVKGVNNRTVIKFNKNHVVTSRDLAINREKELSLEAKNTDFNELKNKLIKRLVTDNYDTEQHIEALALLLLFDIGIRRADILQSNITINIKLTNDTDNWIYRNQNEWF